MFADLQTKLGGLYRDHGDLRMAREHYAFACMANPSYVPARIQLGVTLLAMGNIDDAVAEWNTAMAIEPDNKHVQMYLRVAEAQRAAAASGDIDDLPDEPTLSMERSSLVPFEP